MSWRRSYLDVLSAMAVLGLSFVPPMASLSAQYGDLPTRPASVFTYVLVLGLTLPLAVRTRWPLLCLAIVGPSFVLFQALAYPPRFATVTLYLALYSVGAHQERFRRTTVAAASVLYLGLVVAVELLGSPDGTVEHALFYVVLAVPWALGTYVRRRRFEGAERNRMAAEAAASAERSRIARELHDVVTHHVTAIVVQAGATQYLLAQPDKVDQALTTIGGTGRRALSELRSLLDVLEDVGEVSELVEQSRAGGQPVTFGEDGDLRSTPPAVRLAAYRVVQEGLTNAVKYASGLPTTVRVTRADGRVEVAVVNAVPGRPPSHELSGGRGIGGLRDRVEKLGGSVTAGPDPDGGFRLHATIPC